MAGHLHSPATTDDRILALDMTEDHIRDREMMVGRTPGPEMMEDLTLDPATMEERTQDSDQNFLEALFCSSVGDHSTALFVKRCARTMFQSPHHARTSALSIYQEKSRLSS